jgi:Cu(I)/Ag(I) efflux system membrane fusion protein
MKAIRKIAIITILVSSAAGLVLAGYQMGRTVQPAGAIRSTPASTTGADNIDPKSGRKVLYWHDPMVPGYRFDKPGKSPFMDMELVPVYADEGATQASVSINPTLQQNLGIRYASVTRENVSQRFDLIGSTQFDESRTEVVQSRVTGYIERLHARSPMQAIKRGAPIATLFVPDWIAPQEEYLALKKSGDVQLLAAARARMRAMSLPDEMANQLDRSNRVQRSVTLTSPVSGVITELPLREGAMVAPGATVAKVADLSKLWLVAEVPEALSSVIQSGMSVEASTSAEPTRKYSGKLREVLPGVNSGTRTLQARLELDNKDGHLTPGLLMRVAVGGSKAASRLLVPSEAVIATGKRSVVLTVDHDNNIRPVQVLTGREIGDKTEIMQGLDEGQKVVASGQFLLDSEASLKAVLPRLLGAAPLQGPASPPAPVYHGVGKVEKVNPGAMMLSHKPIPELKWGAMTMEFEKPAPGTFPEIRVGLEVEFSFHQTEDGYVLDSMQPTAGGKR